MSDRFKCPRCGIDDQFVENLLISAWSTVDIHETGVVEEVEYDTNHDIVSRGEYECLACEYKFTKEEFSPTKRIAQAQDELARLAAGEEI